MASLDFTFAEMLEELEQFAWRSDTNNLPGARWFVAAAEKMGKADRFTRLDLYALVTVAEQYKLDPYSEMPTITHAYDVCDAAAAFGDFSSPLVWGRDGRTRAEDFGVVFDDSEEAKAIKLARQVPTLRPPR